MLVDRKLWRVRYGSQVRFFKRAFEARQFARQWANELRRPVKMECLSLKGAVVYWEEVRPEEVRDEVGADR